jgi:hypothetical protein
MSYIDELKAAAEQLDVSVQREKYATIPDAARAMKEIEDFAEELRAVKSKVENTYSRMRFTILPSMMEDEEVTTITVEGVGRVTVADDINVSIPDENKQQFYDWLVAKGFEDMLKTTVNAQTLAAFVRRRLKANHELPQNLLTVRPFTRASITKV